MSQNCPIEDCPPASRHRRRRLSERVRPSTSPSRFSCARRRRSVGPLQRAGSPRLQAARPLGATLWRRSCRIKASQPRRRSRTCRGRPCGWPQPMGEAENLVRYESKPARTSQAARFLLAGKIILTGKIFFADKIFVTGKISQPVRFS